MEKFTPDDIRVLTIVIDFTLGEYNKVRQTPDMQKAIKRLKRLRKKVTSDSV